MDGGADVADEAVDVIFAGFAVEPATLAEAGVIYEVANYAFHEIFAIYENQRAGFVAVCWAYICHFLLKRAEEHVFREKIFVEGSDELGFFVDYYFRNPHDCVLLG